MSLTFQTENTTPPGGRRGVLTLPHGTVQTPVFMPVGTAATVKAVEQGVVESLGAEIILANTYHLYLRPGHELIRQLGGVHRFMSWLRPMLTDSGGFQVFSLAKMRKISPEGVEFQSHLDGSKHFFSPEHSMAVQIALGADIMMVFDECVETPASWERTRDSLALTHAWAQRLVEMELPGYAIGGLAVGEPREVTREMIALTLEHLPADKPRYVMGVGYPDEIEEYARMGVDMMDCVLPTRAGRHGLLFIREDPQDRASPVLRLNIKKLEFAEDQRPLDEGCRCPVCRRYTRAYLRHLFSSGEPLGAALNSIHNLAFYFETMQRVRGEL